MLEGIDLSKVIKGTVFEASWLSERFGIPLADRAYPLKATAFASALESALRKSGRPCTVRTSHDNVVVLTDDEASRYNAGWYESGFVRSRKCHRRMKEVDSSLLDYQQAEAHRIAVGIQAIELAAIKRIRRLANVKQTA